MERKFSQFDSSEVNRQPIEYPMNLPARHSYRLDTHRFGLAGLTRLRRWLAVAGAVGLGGGAIVGFLLHRNLGLTMIALGIATAGWSWARSTETTEVEGIPVAGEFEATANGLNIHCGRGRCRTKPWHAFDTIAYDPNEGLLTLVPEFGFAISLNRNEVKELDGLAKAIGTHARVEFESAAEEAEVAEAGTVKS